MSEETLIAGSDDIQTGEQTKTDDVKVEGEGAAPEAVEPKVEETLEYEFTLPEGIEIDSAEAEEFTTIAKELKLPKEAAQKLVDFATKREAKSLEARNAVVKGWAESVKTDKDIGGDKLTESLATAKKAIDLGPPELKELLNKTGFGNHPAVVKWAYAVGKALSEDRFVPGSKAPVGADKSPAQRLYDKTT